MKAVIYARYSCDSQTEQSIEGQLRECLEYANFNGISVIGNYIDRAYSAKTDNRPEFQRMIKDSYKGSFDLIIVWKLDRFARNRYDSAHYKNLLKKNGVKVVSAKESIADGSEGILLESVLEGMAEYYSAELSEKVQRGMKENALKCKVNGCNQPFGYDVVDQKLAINPTEAAIVKEIFQMCYDGKTAKEIYRYLGEKQVKKKNGKPIQYNAVLYMLSNRTYIGEYKYKDMVIPGGVPAIIEQDLFDAVQREIKKNSHAPARHTADEDYLLTTKLFCGKCGAMMVAQAGTSGTKGVVYRYYACVQQKKHKCDKKMVSKTAIEDFVVSKVLEVLENETVVEQLAQLLYDLQFTENTVLPQLQAELKAIQKDIDNLVSAIRKGAFSDSLVKRLNELEMEKKKIEDSIAIENLECPIYTVEHFKMAMEAFRKIDVSQMEGKQRLIDVFVNSIYLYDDNLKIIFNGNEKEEVIPLKELETAKSSNLVSQGAPTYGDKKAVTE